MNIIVSKDYKDKVISEIKKFYDCYEIGNIIKSNKKILFRHQIFMILTDFIEKISKTHRGT